MAASFPAETMALSIRCSWGASGVVTCSGLDVLSDPTPAAAVVMRPVDTPAASSTAAARNDVVVLPSVPVMPTIPNSWLGSPYHHAAATASARRVSSTTICGRATPSTTRPTIAAAAPRARAAATKS